MAHPVAGPAHPTRCRTCGHPTGWTAHLYTLSLDGLRIVGAAEGCTHCAAHAPAACPACPGITPAAALAAHTAAAHPAAPAA